MKKTFTRSLLVELRSELNEAVRDVAAKHGMVIEFVSAQFDDASAAFRVELKYAATGDYDPGRANWELYCRSCKMEPEDYGKIFSFPGENIRYQIIGINPKARDNPIILSRLPERKEHVAPYQDVRFALEHERFTRLPAIAIGARTDGSKPTPLQRKIEWDVNCWRWEMAPDDFGKEYTLPNGISYRIIGCNPHFIKNTILILNLKTNKEYTISPPEVKALLKQHGSPAQE